MMLEQARRQPGRRVIVEIRRNIGDANLAMTIGLPAPKRVRRGGPVAGENACALQLIRADGLKVIAGCGFVVDYLHKHPEFADLTG